MVYVHVDATNLDGKNIEITIHEDDGLDVGDDNIATLTVLIQNGRGKVAWQSNWQQEDSYGPENSFYAFYDAPFPSSNISTGEYSLGNYQGDLAINPATLYWADGSKVGPSRQPLANTKTWVVVHGRADNPAGMRDVTAAIQAADQNAQVLVVDWAHVSAEYGTTGFGGENYIPLVGGFIAQKLNGLGFGNTSRNLGIVGHSWGALVSHEVAKGLTNGVNSLVALDPAENVPFGYDTNNADFRTKASYSLSLLTSSLGSNVSSARASDSIVVHFDNISWSSVSAHSYAKNVFTHMVNNAASGLAGEISNAFAIGELRAGRSVPWSRDKFIVSNAGVATPADGPFEGSILAIYSNGSWKPLTLLCRDDAGVVKTLHDTPPSGDITPPEVSLVFPSGNGSVAASYINSSKILKFRYTDVGGSGISRDSIVDQPAEFVLTGLGVGTAKLATSPPVLVGGVYEYAFTGEFVPGVVNLTFDPGTFSDDAGNANRQANLRFSVTSGPVQTGAVQVSIIPQEVVINGAQWRVDGGAFQASGTVISGLSVGSHYIEFSQVSGWTTPASQTITVTAGQPYAVTGVYSRQGDPGSQTRELLGNGGFETGSNPSPWQTQGLVAILSEGHHHTGSGYAYLGGQQNAGATIRQGVEIPSNATAAILRYWFNITSAEISPPHVDTLLVGVATAGSGLTIFDRRTSVDRKSGATSSFYEMKNFDLMAYRGQRIDITFQATTNATQPTYFRIDDVSVSVTVPNPPTFTSFIVNGPNAVEEGARAQYSATALFSDGSAQSVTSGLNWSISPGPANIGATGEVSAGSVEVDTTVNVVASHTIGGVTQTAMKSITVVNKRPTLVGLGIGGPTEVDEKTTGQYFGIANFSDGSSQNVTSGWSVSPGNYASIDSNTGLLLASEVSADQTVRVTCVFEGVSAAMDVTIVERPPLPTLSITDAEAIVEGDDGSQDLVFTITLSHAATEWVVVFCDTADGTASGGTDYAAGGGWIAFSPGYTTRTFHVPVYGDRVVEGDEELAVRLSSLSGATFERGEAFGRILDDDTVRWATVNLAASPAAGGIVGGSSVYPVGEAVTVTAAAAPGFAFINWSQDEVVVSTSASYAFTATASRTLLANFADVAPPSGSATASNVSVPSTNEHLIAVLWSDNLGVDVNTIGYGDIVVSGPAGKGYNQIATLVSTDSTSGPNVVARYAVSAPPGGWTSGWNGDYGILNRVGQIADTVGNVMPSYQFLGKFTVDIPSEIGVNPHLVTGKTAALTALRPGTNLATLFGWSVTAKPAGAATPTFSRNNSNAAKAATVTFYKAGTYTLKLTSRTGAVVKTVFRTITVQQTLTSVAVTPATVTVFRGMTRQITASVMDQFGASMIVQPPIAWAVDVGGIGTVTAAGLYEAPLMGTGTARVRASAGAVSGSAAVTVVATAKVNFQPAAAPKVAGYLVDAGGTFAARSGLTYGWSVDHAAVTLDRNRNPNQLLDTSVGVRAGAKWELAVANGTYQVRVSIGDAAVATTNTVRVEGTTAYAGTKLAANVFGSKLVTVVVSDGRLTLDAGAAANLATRLDFVEVTRV